MEAKIGSTKNLGRNEPVILGGCSIGHIRHLAGNHPTDKTLFAIDWIPGVCNGAGFFKAPDHPSLWIVEIRPVVVIILCITSLELAIAIVADPTVVTIDAEGLAVLEVLKDTTTMHFGWSRPAEIL